MSIRDGGLAGSGLLLIGQMKIESCNCWLESRPRKDGNGFKTGRQNTHKEQTLKAMNTRMTCSKNTTPQNL